jgi:hypothetical protein
MTEPIKRRRWFRFSLRMLLVVVTVLCVWLGFKVNAARREHAAITAIRNAGGEIICDFQYVPSPMIPGSLSLDIHQPPNGPAWLRSIFGDEMLNHAFNARFQFRPISISAFAEFKSLPKLKFLYFDDVKLCNDVTRTVRSFRETDFEFLKELTELQEVQLYHTGLSPESIRNLQKMLPNVLVDGH